MGQQGICIRTARIICSASATQRLIKCCFVKVSLKRLQNIFDAIYAASQVVLTQSKKSTQVEAEVPFIFLFFF